MKNDIISIICLLIGYVLYPCILATHGFNRTTVIIGFELIVVTVAVVPDFIKRCKK